MGSELDLVQRNTPRGQVTGRAAARVAAALLLATAAYAQGFGIIKMSAKLQRKRPPAVYLMGTAIDVRVEAQDSAAAPFARQFESLLAGELCRNDARLRVEKTRPETLVEVTVTALEAHGNWVHRKATEYKKVGTKQVWNDKKNQFETKDDYRNVEVTRNYKVAEGALSASLRVTEAGTGNALHSGTIQETYQREFLDGDGAPLDSQIPVLLIQAAISRILPAVVPTIETVEVQMAKGKLEDAGKLGQTGLWARMLETVEAMPPFKKPQDEAYRLYDIGLASEALAYQAEDAGVAQKMLEQAAIQYGKAIDLKPDERYFREPQVRIQNAIAQLGKSEQQKALYARSLEAKAAKSAAAPGARGTGGAETLTNQTVIDLVRSGLDEKILAEMIRESAQVNFDLGPQGTMLLLKEKVSNNIIAVMRARAGKK